MSRASETPRREVPPVSTAASTERPGAEPVPHAYEFVGRITISDGGTVLLFDDGGSAWSLPSLLGELVGKRVRIVATVLEETKS